MIKINLLGVPKPKRGKGRGAAAPEMGGGEGMNPMIILLIGLVAVLGVVGFLYKQQMDRATAIAADQQKAEVRNRQLSEVKATYERKQREAESYKHRVDVIDQLRANQAGPVSLLTMIGDTVNTTEAVWLQKVSDEGGTVKIDGTALNVHAIANLMSNLQRTGFFKTVEMTEALQDDKGEVPTFNFTLTCDKAAPAPPKS